ncbi:hypothetical protein [Salinimonas marina]|uniref:hypothetical protein n=1 Tax=Salinimonas marina TaxID=2785918 RepID=UPI001E31FC16|nr:hypothetical protein [Salinimonas marina]
MENTQSGRRWFLSYNGFFLCCLLLLGGALAAPMDALAQLVVAGCILVFIYFASHEAAALKQYRVFFRVLAVLLGLALTVRYILWRGMYTLNAADWLSLAAAWLLFLAELYAALTHVISCVVNIFPLSRPERSLKNYSEPQLPTVDVFIPTYNEDPEILQVTLRAALQMHYPAHKLHVHLLDDGGPNKSASNTMWLPPGGPATGMNSFSDYA